MSFMRTVIRVTRKLRIASTREIEDTYYVGGHGTAWRGKLAQKIHFNSDKTALIPLIWSVWVVIGLVLQMLSSACGWLLNPYNCKLWREKNSNSKNAKKVDIHIEETLHYSDIWYVCLIRCLWAYKSIFTNSLKKENVSRLCWQEARQFDLLCWVV